MMYKLDKKLMSIVRAMQSENDKIDCLVYAKNYYLAKAYLEKQEIEITEYPFIRAFGIKANFSQVKNLANLTTVNYISSVAKVFAQMDRAKQILEADMIEGDFVGNGVNVAIIDTGITNHLDFCSFKNRIAYFKDFLNDRIEPYDDNGHGTFVSGVLAGNGFASGKKYSGIAPNANIIMCKALDKNGETTSLTILNAMQWIYENKEKFNIRVVCMSFGSQPLDANDPLMLGAEALWNKGIVVVAAAGNSGPQKSSIKSPGISGKIITVGALDDGRNSQGDITNKSGFKTATFSSRGPAYNFYKPDCLAPGVDIICTACKDDLYTKMSGTSVATPIVAGSVALLLEKYPNLTPNQVKSKLMQSCQHIEFDKNSEGFGLLNAKRFCE